MDIIVKHNTLFLALYGDSVAKIKFHHLYHLPDDLLRVGSALSCFPTERKNKDALAVSVATDHTIARSSIIAFLHRTIKHWRTAEAACKRIHPYSGRLVMQGGEAMVHCTSACLHCGDVHKRDMVLLLDGSLGVVFEFWQRVADKEMVVRLHVHKSLGGIRFAPRPDADVFVSVDEVVEPVGFYTASDHIVACVPLYS